MFCLITFFLVTQQLDHFNITPISSPQTAGDSFIVTIWAEDVNNQPVTNYNGQPYVYSSLGPTYSNKQVSFTNGVCQENIMVTLATNMSVICNDYAGHTGQSNNFNVIPNVPSRLLAIVPAETYAPGTQTGKTGNVLGQNAGSSFNVQVYATDSWFNTVDTIQHTVNVTSSDPFMLQTQIQLSNGSTSFLYTFRTAGNRQIYFNDQTNPSIQSETSSSISVSAGPYADLLVILPGEAHVPGDTTSSSFATPGKSGAPNDQYVLEDFPVMVYATDTMWNRTNETGTAVWLNSDFPFSNPQPETLSNGSVQFTINYINAGNNQDLWAEDGSIISSYRSRLNILERPDTTNDTTVVDTTLKAYPNPLGIEGSTVMYFEYELSSSANVILAIYDPFGNLVYRDDITSGSPGAQAGINRLQWNGRNGENERVASGLYLAVLKAWVHTNTLMNAKLKVGVVW